MITLISKHKLEIQLLLESKKVKEDLLLFHKLEALFSNMEWIAQVIMWKWFNLLIMNHKVEETYHLLKCQVEAAHKLKVHNLLIMEEVIMVSAKEVVIALTEILDLLELKEVVIAK